LIYKYDGDRVLHRDINAEEEWLSTWHEENNETLHSEAIRQLENYYNELK